MLRWRIKELAEERGFNAHSLSLAAQLSYNTVRPIWINSARRTDLDTIEKLARALQVAPGDLFEQAAEE